MIKFLKTSLHDLKTTFIYRVNSICVALIIVVGYLQYKYHLEPDFTILLLTPLIWCGITFLLLTALIKAYLNESINTISKKALFILGMLFAIFTFIAPIILYYRAK